VNPPVDDPTLYDDTYLPNAASGKYLDPETAFRESLFDAMADDEGAAFWEGVYGQPIHTYSNVKAGEKGELERMTDEEYAAYVRTKMWEKTHEGLMEEKRRREEMRRKDREMREQEYVQEKDARRFEKEVEASLKRGRERKRRKMWDDLWTKYSTGWTEIKACQESEEGEKNTKSATARIPWPVESGRFKDVSPEEVERFFLNAPSSGEVPESAKLLGTLKTERVRWHPDKIQHRLKDVDGETLKAATAVFQVVDRMWTERRS
jgi:hypothetical protein